MALQTFCDMIKAGMIDSYVLPYLNEDRYDLINKLFRAHVGEQSRVLRGFEQDERYMEALHCWCCGKVEFDTPFSDRTDVLACSSFVPRIFEVLAKEQASSLVFRAVLFSSKYAFEWLSSCLWRMYNGKYKNAKQLLKILKTTLKVKTMSMAYTICQNILDKIFHAVYCEFGFYCEADKKQAYLFGAFGSRYQAD